MAELKDSFYWYDYETFGTDPRKDRAVQFAGIRTDTELNIISAPLMLFSKPANDYIPHPEACLLTGISPVRAMQEGVPEAEFIRRIHDEFMRPRTCVVGYNNIRFDDEVTRFTLYRNFFDAYAREWQNGNSRWDIIDMVRLARAIRPEGINWPVNDEGLPSNRLEDITRVNGLEHDMAHDALSDVYATIAVAKLVKQAQPKLYDYYLKCRNKRFILQQLNLNHKTPLVHVSSRYSLDNLATAIVYPLCGHPQNKNGVIVLDLSADPQLFIELPVEEIRQRLYTPRSELGELQRIPLKIVHINRCPVIAPLSVVNREVAERCKLDIAQCQQHAGILAARPELVSKAAEVFNESVDFEDDDPDFMLYGGGFFSDYDRHMMSQVRHCSPEELIKLDLNFEDERLPEMLFRYRARNYPHTLADMERQIWDQYRRKRLLSGDAGLCSQDFAAIMSDLRQRQDLSAEEHKLLDELDNYVTGLL